MPRIMRLTGMAVAAVTALVLVAAGSGPAVATSTVTEVPAQAPAPRVSDYDYELAFSQFESTDVAREVSSVNGVRTVTFHLVEGFDLTMVDPDSVEASRPSDGGIRPQLSAGFTRAGYYVGFNQFDQNTLSNALLAAGITAAICAIPAVGAAACAIAGVAVSVAVAYINRNGVCSNNRTLYWYDVVAANGARGSTIACRSTVPK